MIIDWKLAQIEAKNILRSYSYYIVENPFLITILLDLFPVTIEFL